MKRKDTCSHNDLVLSGAAGETRVALGRTPFDSVTDGPERGGPTAGWMSVAARHTVNAH
jgi:hypothetical protein